MSSSGDFLLLHMHIAVLTSTSVVNGYLALGPTYLCSPVHVIEYMLVYVDVVVVQLLTVFLPPSDYISFLV